MLLRRTFLFFAACAVGCGTTADVSTNTPADQAQGLIYGEKAHRHQYDEAGGLLQVDAYGSVVAICSATLISPTAVLTAAHCVPNGRRIAAGVTTYYVAGHEAFPATHQHRVKVVQTIANPNYDPNNLLRAVWPWRRHPHTAEEKAAYKAMQEACGSPEDPFNRQAWLQCITTLPADLQEALGIDDASSNGADIAVGLLERPINDRPIALLPGNVDLDLEPGDPLTLIGYGVHDELDSSYGASHSVGQRYVGQSSIMSAATYEFAVAGLPIQVCSGDSGGPALLQSDSKRIDESVVVGVASRDAWAHCDGPIIYTRVDAYEDWIRAVADLTPLVPPHPTPTPEPDPTSQPTPTPAPAPPAPPPAPAPPAPPVPTPVPPVAPPMPTPVVPSTPQ